MATRKPELLDRVDGITYDQNLELFESPLETLLEPLEELHVFGRIRHIREHPDRVIPENRLSRPRSGAIHLRLT